MKIYNYFRYYGGGNDDTPGIDDRFTMSTRIYIEMGV